MSVAVGAIRERRWLAGVVVAVAVGALAVTAGAALAVVVDRDALWPVVRACVADARLTGLPFPCLAVDLKEGDERGHVVLRPPLVNDMVLSPTRRIVGLEDPVLQSPETPNYFAAAWRARNMIATANRQPAARSQVALIVNSLIVRGQDQLHIHIGCLVPQARRVLGETAPKLPLDSWRPIGGVIPHQPFWALRVQAADLDGINPFRLVRDEFARVNPADMMIMVVGAEVAGQDEFLILATYANAPHSWWPVGAEDLLDRECQGEGKPAK